MGCCLWALVGADRVQQGLVWGISGFVLFRACLLVAFGDQGLGLQVLGLRVVVEPSPPSLQLCVKQGCLC